MGKNKEQKSELYNAFSRMNYLYQASALVSKVLPESVLPNYYGRIMKEVSKKVVEKIHPEIKRSLCCRCSYPLFTNEHHASVRVKPNRKSKRRKKKEHNTEREKREYKIGVSEKDSQITQKVKKNFRPNKLLLNCNKCGYSRKFLQRPAHYVWAYKCTNGNV